MRRDLRTKAQILEDHQRLESAYFVLEKALMDALEGTRVKLHQFKEKDGGGTYVFHASSLTSACGGLFWTTFKQNGQRDQVTIVRLDDASLTVSNMRSFTPYHEAFAYAVTRARTELHKALAEIR